MQNLAVGGASERERDLTLEIGAGNFQSPDFFPTSLCFAEGTSLIKRTCLVQQVEKRTCLVQQVEKRTCLVHQVEKRTCLVHQVESEVRQEPTYTCQVSAGKRLPSVAEDLLA